MCIYGSPRAVALAGPYIHWGQGQSVDAQGLVSRWAARISAVPRTEEVAGSVVDTLLQIAANSDLLPFIPPDAWSWLNEQPFLPHDCRGLFSGCNRNTVRTVRPEGERDPQSYAFSLYLSQYANAHGPAQDPTPPSCAPCLSRVRNLAFGTIDV